MYYNDMVPLPMALLTIQARLQNCYYRNAAAVKHDAHLVATNAGTFNGSGSSITRHAESEFWGTLLGGKGRTQILSGSWAPCACPSWQVVVSPYSCLRPLADASRYTFQ